MPITTNFGVPAGVGGPTFGGIISGAAPFIGPAFTIGSWIYDTIMGKPTFDPSYIQPGMQEFMEANGYSYYDPNTGYGSTNPSGQTFEELNGAVPDAYDPGAARFSTDVIGRMPGEIPTATEQLGTLIAPITGAALSGVNIPESGPPVFTAEGTAVGDPPESKPQPQTPIAFPDPTVPGYDNLIPLGPDSPVWKVEGTAIADPPVMAPQASPAITFPNPEVPAYTNPYITVPSTTTTGTTETGKTTSEGGKTPDTNKPVTEKPKEGTPGTPGNGFLLPMLAATMGNSAPEPGTHAPIVGQRNNLESLFKLPAVQQALLPALAQLWNPYGGSR